MFDENGGANQKTIIFELGLVTDRASISTQDDNGTNGREFMTFDMTNEEVTFAQNATFNGLTVSTGHATVTSGNLTVTAGDLTVTAGSLEFDPAGSPATITSTGGQLQFDSTTNMQWEIGGIAELSLSSSVLIPSTDAGLNLGDNANRFGTVTAMTLVSRKSSPTLQLYDVNSSDQATVNYIGNSNVLRIQTPGAGDSIAIRPGNGGSNAALFDGNLHTTLYGDLDVTAGDITAGGDLTVGDGNDATQIYINGTSGTNSDLEFQNAGSSAWRLRDANDNKFKILSGTATTTFEITDTTGHVTIPIGDLTLTAGSLDVGANIEFNDFFYFPEPTTRFISAVGQLTITSSHQKVDTAGGAASDDLDNIAGGTRDGQIVILRPANSSRDVTVRHNAGGTGNIRLEGNADWTWANTDCRLGLMYSGTTWFEIFRADT
jgi:lipopolysaccharide export system protein LptA